MGDARDFRRHRHRYEFNREYEKTLIAAGLRITGETPDQTYVEICEIADHPWYLNCQFHPEFKSKPMHPHPLFTSFIGAAYDYLDAAFASARGAAFQPCRLATARSGRASRWC